VTAGLIEYKGDSNKKKRCIFYVALIIKVEINNKKTLGTMYL